MKIQWRHQYDATTDAEARAATDIASDDPGKTQQHFAKDCDINEMVKRFGITDGALPPKAMDPSFYGDFSDVPSFRAALDRTRDAIDRFGNLPADLRNRFGNDPIQLWDYVNNEKNADEAVKLGLLARKTPQPPAAPAVTPPPTTPATQ